MKVREIDIRAIKQGDNSRMSYDHIEMAKLMQSMKHEGLLHPIGVRKDGNGFVVIYGNRRLLAAQKLGWKTIAATELEDTGEADELFKNLNENMHRKDVSLAEMGRYLHHLKNDLNLKEEEIAARLGMEKHQVVDCIHLYDEVPKKYQRKVTMRGDRRPTAGKISPKAAQEILNINREGVGGRDVVEQLFDAATERSLSGQKVRRVARLVTAGLTVKKAIEALDSLRPIELRFFMKQSEVDRIEKRYKKSINQVLMGTLRRSWKVSKL